MRALLQAAGSTAALVAIYYLLPLDHFSTWVAFTILAIGLMVLIGLAAFQVRWIVGSRFPALRGVEALATSIPLFLLLICSAPSCLAASTASRPTAPSSTTVTVLPGPDVGVDCTEPAGAENIGGSQQAGDQVQVRLTGRGDQGAVCQGDAQVIGLGAPPAPTYSRWAQRLW